MKQTVLALGFFDGVHLGHGALLRRTAELAGQLGMTPAALTLDRHPSALFSAAPTKLLTTPDERSDLMRALYGIAAVFVLPFDAHTGATPWEDFVEQTLVAQFHAGCLVCGQDYRFGAGGMGTPELLKEKCASLGIGCACVPDVCLEGQKVSSTVIRSLLAQGEMAKAVRFLGHPHLLRGTVVSGRHLGRTLGIPTANLHPSPELLLPRFGVYAAKAYFDGEERMAVVNIGRRPTVHGETVTVEPWILDFDGDLYGHTLTLALYDFLRPEQKFPSLEALTAAIRQNAVQTRTFFASKE